MKTAIYNPNNTPVELLPIIYGFNNGGSYGCLHAQLIAEDGTRLGGHMCSDEGFMYDDLGILEGTRPDRHKGFQEHYPDGYKMDFVSSVDVKYHVKLNEAFVLNQAMGDTK